MKRKNNVSNSESKRIKSKKNHSQSTYDPIEKVLGIPELLLNICQRARLSAFKLRLLLNHQFYDVVSSDPSLSMVPKEFFESDYQSRFPKFSLFKVIPSNLPLIDQNGEILNRPFLHAQQILPYIIEMFKRCTSRI